MASDPAGNPQQDAWTREARRVARRVNFGWWIQSLTPPLVIIGLTGACALLLVRREHPATPGWQLVLAAAAALLLLAGIAWLIARRRFETPETSLVRIEAAMLLRNSLSAARAGVAPWPPVPNQVDAGISWNWQRVIIPPLAALLFLLAGLLLPVSAVSGNDDGPPDEPLALRQIDDDLKRLGQDDVIDEAYLEEMRRKLDEMRAKDEEEWFSHASLEAADSLKQQHESEIQRLERELGRADQALGNLQKNADSMPQARKDQLLNQFDQALQGLENGALKPDPRLLEQLRQLDPDKLGQLDPNQLQQLREGLKKAGQACKDCQGGGDGQGDQWLDDLLNQGEDPGEKEGNGPGKGDVTRGPGHAPGVLGKEGDPLKTGDLEGLEAKDLSQALPGDLLQLQDGQHEADPAASSVRGGGGIDSAGTGGDRVWKDSLSPDEQKVLKRFNR